LTAVIVCSSILKEKIIIVVVVGGGGAVMNISAVLIVSVAIAIGCFEFIKDILIALNRLVLRQSKISVSLLIDVQIVQIERQILNIFFSFHVVVCKAVH